MFLFHKINPQYVAMFSASLMSICVGVNVGWTSPYLPYLLSAQSHIKTTPNEGFWCAVASLLGAPFGSFMGALLVDRIGRKLFLLSTAPITILCFITMAYSRSILVIILPRCVLGSIEGGIYSALPIYFGEISDPKIRGKISASVSVASTMGTIFINVIGPFLSIKDSSLICCTFPIIFFLIFLSMPESPYYYLKKQQTEKAKRSLSILRNNENVDKELEEITAAVNRQEALEKGRLFDLFLVASNRKALFIYIILAFTNKFSGKNPITYYTTIIFMQADGILSPVISTIIFSLVGLIITILVLIFVDRFGRRPLMITSALGCSISLAAQAVYFTIQNFYPEYQSDVDWLPVVALISYNIMFSAGLAYGPVLYLSELFPTSVKAIALFFAENVSVTLATTVSKFFQATDDAFGMFVPFWTFAACAFCGSFLIYFYVPETKGKTLEQIQLELIGNKRDK